MLYARASDNTFDISVTGNKKSTGQLLLTHKSLMYIIADDITTSSIATNQDRCNMFHSTQKFKSI